jgi:GNAT superfamily N-acetyltransferase
MTNERADIHCRRATGADVEALAELRWQMSIERQHASVSREEYVAAFCDTVRDPLAQGTYLGWLAEAKGTPVACAVLIWWPMPPTAEELQRRRGYVSSVYTRPEYRRLGLARTLMEMLLASARDLGIRKVLLNSSTMGRQLYLNMGFETNERVLEIKLF